MPYRVYPQIALLVAGINYVLEVETTLERVDEGNNAALTGYHELQVRVCCHALFISGSTPR